MAKRNVRVDIPRSSPDKMLDLSERIHERHTELGDDTPLHHEEMTDIPTKVAAARAHLKKADKLHEEAEAETQHALNIIGIAKGQTIKTSGTLYNKSGRARSILVVKHENEEEEISKYGYNVVIS